jgi:hypothetical protein
MMSSLAALASKTSSDEQLLGSINDALLQLQLEAAGKAADLGYKKEDLELSRKVLAEFLSILLRVIGGAQKGQLLAAKSQQEQAAEKILLRLDDQGKPREDWLEDIARTTKHLESQQLIDAPDWSLLEQMVDFLDTELARDLVALSKA